ncbi:MAG: hypothetical protein ACYTFI_10370 [Planctomycetota bacterium]|jgi:hypothetical protein
MRAVGLNLAAAGALALLGAGAARGAEAPTEPSPHEPSIEEMLEEIERHKADAGESATKAPQPRPRTRTRKRKSGSLRGIILSDPKPEPGGRFTLTFDPASPLHRYDLVDRGLAARFVEIQAEIKLTNDGRWDRVFQLGDFTLKHLHRGGQRIEAGGKRLEKEHAIPTDCRRREGEPRASRTYTGRTRSRPVPAGSPSRWMTRPSRRSTCRGRADASSGPDTTSSRPRPSSSPAGWTRGGPAR